MAVVKFGGAGVDMRDAEFGLSQLKHDNDVLLNFVPVSMSSHQSKGKLDISFYDSKGHALDMSYAISAATPSGFRLSGYGLKISETGGSFSYTGKFNVSPSNFAGKITGVSYSNHNQKYIEISKMSAEIDFSKGILNLSNEKVFAGNDAITGSDFSDYLSGFAGNDVIKGGLGDDSLEGGKGVDTLYGGAGADKFVFSERTTGPNWDKLMDFKHAEGDSLVFDTDVFTNHSFVTLNRMSDKKDVSGLPLNHQGFAFEKSTGNLYYDADGLGARKAPELGAHLVGVKELSVDDFHFI